MRFAYGRFGSLSVVLALLITAGCKAQVPAGKATVTDPVLARRIEVLVRAQFNIPADYNVTMGERKPSDIPGFDSLTISIARATHTTTTDFLISTDNKSLGRFEKFDLTKEPGSNIAVNNRPIRGNPAAKVTVVNFDDLECPYCARMHQQLFPATLDRYKDKVKFVYKDDPLVDIHPWALHAAVDSNCLAEQNASAYWGYVDYLHAHGQEVTGEDRDPKKSYAVLDKITTEQGKIFALDPTKLEACVKKQDEAPVRESMKEAESLGVEGTPYLFIDGEHVNGALPEEQVWEVIDRALRAAGVEPPPAPAAQQPMTAPPLGN